MARTLVLLRTRCGKSLSTIPMRRSLQMIEQPRAYYLIEGEGAIVQIVLEDVAAGMSQIHSA
jgi:hypothetical protein